MHHLFSGVASPHSSPTKMRRTNSLTNVHSNSANSTFLNKLSIGLTEGIESVHDIYLASERESFISANTTIFNELHHYQKGLRLGLILIPLNNATLHLKENEHGVEMEMNGITKFLPSTTFEQLTETLSNDITTNMALYGNAFSNYVKNIVNYEEILPVFHKTHTKNFNKSQLYFSMGEDRLIDNLNGEVAMPLTNANFVCRHFSAYAAYLMLNNRFGKIDWSFFKDKGTIAANMPSNIEAIYNAFKAHAVRSHIVKNSDLGKHIKTCFEEMKDPGTVKALLIESADHTMMMRLHVKGTAAKPIYVVNFYDPNITTTSVRCAPAELTTFDTHTLQQYIDGWTQDGGNYPLYFADMEPITLVLECSLDSLTKTTVENTKKLGNVIPGPLTPTHLYLLLSNNFYHDLIGLKDQLRKIGETSPEELCNLLAAKSQRGLPGLYIAMQNGFTGSVSGFSELIHELSDLIPEDKRAELIAAKTPKGNPAFYAATEYGNADTAQAWCAMLPLISDKAMYAEIITAENVQGTPAGCMALRKGDENIIQIHGKLMLFINDQDLLIELIAAETTDGRSGLGFALQENEMGGVRAVKEWITLVKNNGKRDALIIRLIKNAASGLFDALNNNYTETIQEFGELFQLIPNKELRLALINALKLGKKKTQFLQLTNALNL